MLEVSVNWCIDNRFVSIRFLKRLVYNYLLCCCLSRSRLDNSETVKHPPSKSTCPRIDDLLESNSFQNISLSVVELIFFAVQFRCVFDHSINIAKITPKAIRKVKIYYLKRSTINDQFTKQILG